MNALSLTLRRRPRVTFGVVALGMLAGYALIIPWHGQRGQGPLPDWTMAFDLLLMLPLLWWWLQPAPRGRSAVFGAVAVAMAGIWIGAWLLPPENKSVWLVLEPLRWVLIGAAVLVQLALTTLALRQLHQVLARRRRALRMGQAAVGLVESDLHAVLDTQAARASRRLGTPASPALPWLKLEARLWLYALAPRRWLDTLPPPGERWFGVHRHGQNLSNQMGFVILAAVEIPVMHLLLHLWFGSLVAGVVTALSVYGVLFLWAEARATRWRPVALDDTRLHLRHGLVTDLVLPRQAIVQIEPHRGAAPPRAKGRLRIVGMGRANLRLQLAPGTRIATLTGEREVSEIFLGVDEPERLTSALQPAPGASTP